MLNKILQFSLRNKLLILLLTGVWILWGLWSAARLPIDAVPDITNNQVQVFTACPTLASEEVEQLVTFPIERALANLPQLEEMRSISRFGLSVVTVVFSEETDIYFARQLIGERLKDAQSQIPATIGTPELAPVSTGLGEVYQYIIHPRKGSEQKYSAMELRTMQDWIVARQLIGTPGIAEVNSFGGLLKEYEVSVDPFRLRAMGLSIQDVFEALRKNNENTGAAYIDKKPNAYFIRGLGMASSFEDIRQMAVKSNPNGISILLKDVAEVGFGHAPRYGAMTYNGEVDAVGGIVMMLKGENSAELVSRVKEKMKTIQNSLPDDVTIEPYLDRTDLVKRAIATVEKNLLEGALIVIFVLVLFLGNFRAGLIVASAIPLSLLFALGLMRVFGVSANLMSLGAIDFGLIVDGAVIIVEATLHHLGLRKGLGRMSQAEMDEEVYQSASGIRKSAAFGELIILLVYLPILSLSGIEGKMFKPMAQTVGFAIIGALILSLTYIPVMCALLLPKTAQGAKADFSARMMGWMQRQYRPLLERVLRIPYWIMGVTLALFAVSVFLFSRMGGEFIPQLQEGDFAFHCILPQGSSLEQSIETSMQASRIIKSFPEVRMVVGKTGSAEVPTDPMPPEATDLMIILHPQDEWSSGLSYDELGEAMMEKLAAIPGVFFEKNQPIQMRFNELMTGIRQDVALKIFGENRDTLEYYSRELAEILEQVPGVTEPMVERVSGMPQIAVEYNRQQLANYGLNVEEVNHILSTAFAGEKAGIIFENERQFDLVVRLKGDFRSDPGDIGQLFLPTPSGNQIPLSQVASIRIQEGPAQVSRESGRRRMVIGFNVQGRDVQSVVKDIRQLVSRKVDLPEGYYLTYGGTFENLEKATARLRIAVPAALLLIFLLLYFTFHSMRQAALIFTAIPMAAIGGVLALLARDMPFSISAGIGFIALFGVAVLNGIVLIGTFNQLEENGVSDILERIREGTRIRLRPVLMTATVASLGFLPMAISTSAGAEVQKPLATVVIGGLISATLLTLFVLPILYYLFRPRRKVNMTVAAVALVFCCLGASSLQAQGRPDSIRYMSLEEALQTGLAQNLGIKLKDLEIEQAGYQALAAAKIPKTGVFIENEDQNRRDPQGILKIGINQGIEFPSVYKRRRELGRQEQQLQQRDKVRSQAELSYEIRLVYNQIQYWQRRSEILQEADSSFRQLRQITALRVRQGESPGIEALSAETRYKEWQSRIRQAAQSLLTYQLQLQQLLHSTDLILPRPGSFEKWQMPQNAGDIGAAHPQLRWQEQRIAVAEANVRLQQSQRLPDLSTRLFHQKLYGISDGFYGYSFTLGVPIFGAAYRHALQAAGAEKAIRQAEWDISLEQLQIQRAQALADMRRESEALAYFESGSLVEAGDLQRAALQSYAAGESSYANLVQYQLQALDIRLGHVEAILRYNEAVIRYLFISNQ